MSRIDTEEQWWSCTEPEDLLRHLVGHDRISSRQARLFACACARHIWHLITDERSRDAVEVAERYADGLATDAELLAAFEAAFKAMHQGSAGGGNPPPLATATGCVATEHEYAKDYFFGEFEYFPFVDRPHQLALVGAKLALRQARMAVGDEKVGPPKHADGGYSPRQSKLLDASELTEKTTLSRLLRDIAGNPFSPPVIDKTWLAWNDGVVQRLARRIYDERACDLYPILADALEEAGCTDATFLEHCRQPEEHPRGCWLIDALLELEQGPPADAAFVPYPERTWLRSANPQEMLVELLHRPWNRRKLRLFMVACCRALGHLLTDPRFGPVLNLAERYSDGLASTDELQATFQAITPTEELLEENLFAYHLTAMVAATVAPDPTEDSIEASSVWDLFYSSESAVGMHAFLPEATVPSEEAEPAARAVQANLLREVFGNPFRPVVLAPQWRTPAVLKLAQLIAADRAFPQLPELAVALEKAGCDEATILDHCRSPGPHVYGCWVVDALLGKG